MDDLAAWKSAARQHRGITRELAAFVAGLRDTHLPGPTRDVLRKAMVDAIGCGLHGLGTPWGRMMQAFAAEQGGPAEAGLWGAGQRVSVAHSVLSAGTAIHSFAFDAHSRAKIHPGAVVIPVALALAERERAPGPVVLAAVAAGYETMNRVSQGANPGRARMRGWHLTGTCGSLASAAAASVILGLDADTTASALGLAGTQSAGLWAFTADASMSKRMHPGRAAQAGVVAALLARRGFLGPRQILEAEDGGLLFALSDAPRPERVTQGLGSTWHIDATCFTPHACCGSNHACVDAAIDLLDEHGLQAEDIAHVRIGIPSVVMTQTGFDYLADSVLNAQMSVRFNVAVAMHDRQAFLEQFTPEQIVDPAVVALARSMTLEIDPEVDREYPEVYGGKVTFTTRDGRRLEKHLKYSRGMPENPMSMRDIERKFMSTAGAAVGAAEAAALLPLAAGVFEAESVAPLTDRLTQARIAATDVAPA